MIARDRKSHELIERHLIGGINLQQVGRDGSQLQPLFHNLWRDEKPRGDILFAEALIFQGLERAELVERMERLPLDVLGQRVFLQDTVFADDAGDGRGLVEALLLGQQFQRPITPPAGLHLVAVGGLTILVEHRPHAQTLQQRAPGDVLG